MASDLFWVCLGSCSGHRALHVEGFPHIVENLEYERKKAKIDSVVAVSLQGLCVRQQEQPADEGADRPPAVQSCGAQPRRLRPPGSGHGQRHLPQVQPLSSASIFHIHILMPLVSLFSGF